MAFKPSSIAIFKTMRSLRSFTANDLEVPSGAPLGSCSASCSQLVARGILHEMSKTACQMVAKNGRQITTYRTVYRIVDTLREMSEERAIEIMCSNEKLEFDGRFKKRGGH